MLLATTVTVSFVVRLSSLHGVTSLSLRLREVIIISKSVIYPPKHAAQRSSRCSRYPSDAGPTPDDHVTDRDNHAVTTQLGAQYSAVYTFCAFARCIAHHKLQLLTLSATIIFCASTQTTLTHRAPSHWPDCRLAWMTHRQHASPHCPVTQLPSCLARPLRSLASSLMLMYGRRRPVALYIHIAAQQHRAFAAAAAAEVF